MDDLDARFHLLPDDPLRFFELPENHTRKDLKRHYAALIKRYKPEKFPAEFQRIREAYEILDRDLRYRGEQAPTSMVFDWGQRDAGDSETRPTRREEAGTQPATREPPESIQRDAEPVSSPEVPCPVSLVDRLKTDTPQQIYGDLRGRPDKTPYDHYALAVLGEIVEGGPELLIEHLVAGLEQFPEEPGLLSVLYHTLNGSRTLGALPELLENLAGRLAPHRYYPITEALWIQLVDELPFADLAALLDRCESRFSDPLTPSRVVFTLKLVRVAFFRADDEWIEEKTSFLFENYQLVVDTMEEELDMLEMLLEYHRKRAEFLGGSPHPLRALMDRTLRDFCERSEVEADRTFLECQLEILSDNAILEAFPVADESYGYILQLFQWLSIDVELRVQVERTDPDRSDVYQRTVDFMHRIERLTDRSRFGKLWGLFGYAYLVAMFFMFVTPAWIVGALVPEDVEVAAFLGTLVLWAPIAWFWLRPKYIEGLRQWLAMCIARRTYRGLWRPEIVGFMGTTHIPCDDIEHQIGKIDNPNITNHDWIVIMMDQDYGISFYSLAQRFLH